MELCLGAWNSARAMCCHRLAGSLAGAETLALCKLAQLAQAGVSSLGLTVMGALQGLVEAGCMVLHVPDCAAVCTRPGCTHMRVLWCIFRPAQHTDTAADRACWWVVQISTVVIAERIDPLAVQYAAVTRAATMAIAPRAKFFALPVAYAQPLPLPKS